MSRLDTQQRLSQGPRDLETPQRFLVSPQRVAPARVNNFAALLQGTIQVSAQVTAQQKAAQQQQDAEDFQTAMNVLAEKKGMYDRGDLSAADLMDDYDSSLARFTDPKQQADLIRFGEPFKTSIVQKREAEEVEAASGFFDTKLRELTATLLQDQEFVDDVSGLPYPDQLEAIRGELIGTIPEDMLSTVNENPEFGAQITRYVLNIAGSTSKVRSDKLRAEETRLRQYAVQNSVSKLLSGADTATIIHSLTETQGIPEEDVFSSLTDTIVGNIKTAESIGSTQELSDYIRAGAGVLQNTPHIYGKERAEIASAMSQAQQSIGTILGESLLNRAEVAKMSGADPRAVEGAVVDTLLIEAEDIFGQIFDSPADLFTFTPANATERGLHQSLMDVYQSVIQQEQAASERVQNAIASVADPDNTPPASATSPLDMGQADLSQFLDGLQDTETNPSTLRLIDSARSDRSALIHLLTATYGDSTRAGSVAKKIGDEHLSSTSVTDEGLRQTLAALEGLGTLQDIHLITGAESGDKQYALGKAWAMFAATGEVSADAYNQALQQYRQARFETGSGDRQDLATALNDPKVFKELTGVVDGAFSPSQMSLILQAANIGLLDENGSKRDDKLLASQVKESLANAGLFMVSDSVQGDGRRFVGLTTSRAIPEAIGISTEAVDRGLNNRLSRVDRFLASHMTNGGQDSMWDLAMSKVSGLAPDRAESVLTMDALLSKRDKGEARIVLGAASAGKTVPVVLVLNEQGQQPRATVLGELDFSDSNVQNIMLNVGSRGYLSPETLQRMSRASRTKTRSSGPRLYEGIGGLEDAFNP